VFGSGRRMFYRLIWWGFLDLVVAASAIGALALALAVPS